MLPAEQLITGLLMTTNIQIKMPLLRKNCILNGFISAVHLAVSMQSVSVKVHHQD